MQKPLGPLEALLFAYTQLRRLRSFRVGELRAPLHLTPRQELQLLNRMTRKKLLVRLARGVYLMPPQVPLGGAWTPSAPMAINSLMTLRGGRYQICGPNCFNRYGFDTQIPNRTYLYNDRLSGSRRIGAVELELIKVSKNRLGGIDSWRTPEGLTVVYSSRARTLVDAVQDWKRFQALPRAYEWMRRDLKHKRVTAGELVDTAIRFGNQSTRRRIGAFLEARGTSTALLSRLQRAIRSSTRAIPLDPTRPARGKPMPRWAVIANV